MPWKKKFCEDLNIQGLFVFFFSLVPNEQRTYEVAYREKSVALSVFILPFFVRPLWELWVENIWISFQKATGVITVSLLRATNYKIDTSASSLCGHRPKYNHKHCYKAIRIVCNVGFQLMSIYFIINKQWNKMTLSFSIKINSYI